jgi:hypothetical protein
VDVGRPPAAEMIAACWLLAALAASGLAALLHALCHAGLAPHLADPLPIAVLSLGAVGVLLVDRSWQHARAAAPASHPWQGEVAGGLEAAARCVAAMLRTDSQVP